MEGTVIYSGIILSDSSHQYLLIGCVTYKIMAYNEHIN
jgi:hypothetical protein